MSNNYQLRKPLLQAGTVLAVFCIFILFVNGAHPTSFIEAVAAVFIGIFKTFLFILGLSIGLAITIALLMAVFFAAVSMYSPELASNLYGSLKKSLLRNLDQFSEYVSCDKNAAPTTKIETAELERMDTFLNKANSENSSLKNSLSALKTQLLESSEEISSLKSALEVSGEEKTAITEELDTFKAQVEGLEKDLAAAKEKITALTAEKNDLAAKSKELESTLTELQKTVTELEDAVDKSPEAGIFSYIESEEDKDAFISAIDEAIAQEMTYAQIDEHLSFELEAELDAIIKAHPSLTKNYIRNKRRKE